MVLRKSDLTESAQELGLWETLCELAGLGSLEGSGLPSENDDVEIDISKTSVSSNPH
jgi:hypothetical protein